MNLSNEWREFLASELEESYFIELESFLQEEYATKVVYPEYENIFRAFNLVKPSEIKVVIIGQDPYHGENQANGLAFSVSKSSKIPPSLRNIYKELVDDIGAPYPKTGELEDWAKQGVFMSNSVLTVLRGEPNSHKGRGWERFTDTIIKKLSNEYENILFILWGGPSQKKERLIDLKKHAVIKSAHPSPLSAYRGFFGSKPFSKANSYLRSCGKSEIDWALSAEQTLL